MSAAIARLYAEMDLKNGKFKRGSDEVVRESSRMRKALGGIATAAAGFLAANVIERGLSTVKNEIGNVIGAASDMGETVSKVNAVFGSNADAILKWGQNAEATLGMADEAALSATATIGNLFKGIGIGTDKLPVMSKAILQASADLGSFNNIDPGQVFEDLKSGLVGEAEPLRKYGILINEAAVKTKGMELGLADANGEMSESAKVQARYALIMDQLGDANGDFAKTAQGAANGTRTLMAYIQGLRVWLGGKLLPTWTKVINTANRFAKRIQDLTGNGVKPLSAVLRALHVMLHRVFGKQAGDAIFEFIRVGIRIFRLFRQVVTGDWGGAWETLQRIARDGQRALKATFNLLWPLIRDAFLAIDWGAVGSFLWDGVQGAFGFLTGTAIPWIGEQGKALIGALWGAIDWEAIGNTVWFGLQTAFTFVTDTAPSWLLEQGRALLNALFALDWEQIGGNVWAGVKTAFGFVVTTATGAATWLGEQGYALLKGLWGLDWNQVATDIWNGLWTALQTVKTLGAIALDAIVDLAGDLKAIRDDAATWVANALNWTGDKTVNVGKIILKGDVNIEDTGGGDKGGGLRDFLSGAWEFAKDFPNKFFSGLATLEGWAEEAGAFAAKIVNWTVNGLYDAITNLSVDDIEKIGKAIAGVFLAAFAVQSIANAILSLPSRLVTGFLQGFVGAEADKLQSGITTWVEDKIITPVKDALGIASPSTVFAAIGADVVAGLQSAFDFNSIFNFFWSIGRAITGGVVSGISSMWSDYVNQINALITEAQRVKDALAIHSPSRFMADVGANYVKGMVVGIQKGLPELERSVGAVTSAAMGASPETPSLATRAVTPVAAMGRGGGGNRPINLKVVVNGANKTNDEVGEAVAKIIMRRVRFHEAGAA